MLFDHDDNEILASPATWNQREPCYTNLHRPRKTKVLCSLSLKKVNLKAECRRMERGGVKKLLGLGNERNQHKKTQKNSERNTHRTKTMNI